MEAARAKEEITVLRRLIAYSEKIFDLSRDVVAPISDRRQEPRISTAVVVKSALVMFWARIVSLNALELAAGSRFWKHGSASRPAAPTPWGGSTPFSPPMG